MVRCPLYKVLNVIYLTLLKCLTYLPIVLCYFFTSPICVYFVYGTIKWQFCLCRHIQDIFRRLIILFLFCFVITLLTFVPQIVLSLLELSKPKTIIFFFLQRRGNHKKWIYTFFGSNCQLFNLFCSSHYFFSTSNVIVAIVWLINWKGKPTYVRAGLWWWSCSHLAHRQFQQSKFESRWCLQFDSVFFWKGRVHMCRAVVVV